MRLKGNERSITQARAMRRTMSLPEVLLWRELRKQPGGVRFRRQHPAGPFILDFFCAPAKLAIEIDREAHNRGDRAERDRRKDEWLADQGICVMRIAASDVLNDMAAVLKGLMAAATRTPPPPPSAVPLPR